MPPFWRGYIAAVLFIYSAALAGYVLAAYFAG